MPKITFTASTKMQVYNGSFTLKDGDTQEVDEGVAQQLCADFPDNFSATKAFKPTSNKAMKPTKDK